MTKTAETVLQWHYTKDELPQDCDEWYFVAVKYQGGYKEITMLEYKTDEDGDFLGWYNSENENVSDMVYAWCEIPKPPKEKECLR